MKPYLPVLLLALCVGCSSDATGPEDEGPPAWLSNPLVLPDSFEGKSLGQVTLEKIAGTSLEQVYTQQTYAQRFAYEEGYLQGYIVGYDTQFEAQYGHETAKQHIWGLQSIPQDVGDVSTLTSYDTQFFYEDGSPYLFFFLKNFAVYFTIDPLGQNPGYALTKAVVFANDVFRANNAFGTRPPPPVEIKIISIDPAQGTALVLGAQVTVTVTVAYTLGIDEKGTIRLSLDAQAQNMQEFRQKDVEVQKGSGTVTLSETFLLASQLPENIPAPGAMISLIPDGADPNVLPASSGGSAQVGSTAFLAIRYSVQ